jgi:HAD superfamily hydrolase (TIGR01509 family)
MGFRGAIFDVDGVLVDTPHERAWRDTLRNLMETEWSEIRGATTYAPEAFTPEVYQQVISGKPRLSGARAALEYFSVPDPETSAEVYAERKQRMVVELIEAGEFTAFPDALRFVLALRGAGMRLAAASSSKNAGLVLRKVWLDAALNLSDVLDADISGRDFARGKPDPEIFLTAARELDLPVEECFVAEDAVSGVSAAKAGGIAALGVARSENGDLLAAAGADLVVMSLDEVDIDAIPRGRLVRRTEG